LVYNFKGYITIYFISRLFRAWGKLKMFPGC